MTTSPLSNSPSTSETPPLPKAPQRLDSRAKTLWRVSLIISAVIAFPVLAGIVSLAFSDTLLVILVSIVALMTIGTIILLPELRWRRWRYQVHAHEIELHHGLVWRTCTVVPLTRVQHVDVRQGPLERGFGLSAVVFHTAAEEHKIPALDKNEANSVRNQIATLTRSLDDI